MKLRGGCLDDSIEIALDFLEKCHFPHDALYFSGCCISLSIVLVSSNDVQCW